MKQFPELIKEDKDSYKDMWRDSMRSCWWDLIPFRQNFKVLNIAINDESLLLNLAYKVKQIDTIIQNSTLMGNGNDMINVPKDKITAKNKMNFLGWKTVKKKTNNYDAILLYSKESLYKEIDLKDLLRLCFKLINNNGYIFFAFENRFSIFNLSLFKALRLKEYRASLANGFKERVFTLNKIKKEFYRAGFRKINIYVTFPSYEDANIIISSGNKSLITFFVKYQVLSFVKSWPFFKKMPFMGKLAQITISTTLFLRLEYLLGYFMPGYFVIAQYEGN